MKLNKIFLLGLVAALGLTACSEDEDYTPGAPRTENAAEVNFEANPGSISLGAADTEFTLTVSREKTEGALSVPLIASQSVDGIFTVPATAEFADGEAETEIVVKASAGMEIMKEYKLYITIPEEYYDQYGQDAFYPNMAITIMRNDYKVVAEGVYRCAFFDEEWEQDLEYSEALGRYRLNDLWYPGSKIEFTWDQEANVVAPCQDALSAIGSSLGWETGYNHPNYGPVFACPLKYTNGAWAYDYIPSADAFSMYHAWRVSAGSFGNLQDAYFVENWLEGGE